MIVVAGVLSKKMAKINPKAVLVIAPIIVGVGLLFFSRIPVHANYLTDILPGIVLMAAGMAAVFVTATVVTTSGLSHEESGLVSGLLNTVQQVGGAIGLAVLSVVSSSVTKHELAKNGSSDGAAALTALVHGFQRGFLVAALFTVIATIVAIFVLKVHKPTAADLAQEAETEAEALPAIPGV